MGNVEKCPIYIISVESAFGSPLILQMKEQICYTYKNTLKVGPKIDFQGVFYSYFIFSYNVNRQIGNNPGHASAAGQQVTFHNLIANVGNQQILPSRRPM